eukprot:1455092-Rhodomonas_salina.1
MKTASYRVNAVCEDTDAAAVVERRRRMLSTHSEITCGGHGPDGGPCSACDAGKFKCEGGLTPCIFNTTTYTKSELQAEISQCGSGNQLSCCFVENADTSAITDMSRLFELSSFTGDISKWNVSAVKSMASVTRCMFCSSSLSVINPVREQTSLEVNTLGKVESGTYASVIETGGVSLPGTALFGVRSGSNPLETASAVRHLTLEVELFGAGGGAPLLQKTA